MKTPNGRECPHYYQDFYRGRNVQECRLEKANPNSLRWMPADCSKCPVPDILNANASPYLELTLTISRAMLGLRRVLTVTAHCSKHNVAIADPYIGCVLCAEERGGLDLFRKALEENGEQDGEDT